MDLWLDTDPGFDDWMAWLLMESVPGWRLHGVSVVAGNAPLETTLGNALRIKSLHGLATPVYAGCDRPLAQPQVTAQDVLGIDGMASTGRRLDVPPAAVSAGHGVTALIDAVRANPGRITLLAVGPLTNVATAFLLAPDLPGLLKSLVIMGGSTVGGNATAAAEFNIHADPEAAAQVFGSGTTVRMFGLNICKQLRVGDAHVQRLRAAGSDEAGVMGDYLDGYVDIGRRQGRTAQSLYDPTPVIYLAHPGRFELRMGRVDIELSGRHTRGMTVCDLRGPALARANAMVAMEATRGPELVDWAMERLAARLAR
ncbi:MAG: nucleoside hydrolase [Rubrivivax sp.]|nr:nucleoside hydrolase [Rubrivivax sp.]